MNTDSEITPISEVEEKQKENVELFQKRGGKNSFVLAKKLIDTLADEEPVQVSKFGKVYEIPKSLYNRMDVSDEHQYFERVILPIHTKTKKIDDLNFSNLNEISTFISKYHEPYEDINGRLIRAKMSDKEIGKLFKNIDVQHILRTVSRRVKRATARVKPNVTYNLKHPVELILRHVMKKTKVDQKVDWAMIAFKDLDTTIQRHGFDTTTNNIINLLRNMDWEGILVTTAKIASPIIFQLMAFLYRV